MRLLPILLSALAVATALPFDLSGDLRNHWAVLVSGARGWGNYRHQSDICHAAQILKQNGMPEDHIITMVYDDIAFSPNNPFPGQVFNEPSTGPGRDVYEGCITKKSYVGDSVTTANLIAVLTGNATAVTGGSGYVLESDANSMVFFNYVDHGSTGVLSMPAGSRPYLYANELFDAVKQMKAKNMYDKMAIYIEACYAGSMFNTLPYAGLDAYITTAAHHAESSWGTYCPPNSSVNGKSISTCLGDLYSVNWMRNAEFNPTNTLQKQYEIVRDETHNSHVMQYGDLYFTNYTANTFQGNAQPPASSGVKSLRGQDARIRNTEGNVNVNSRLANLHSLEARAQIALSQNNVNAAKLVQAVADEKLSMRLWDETFSAFSKLALGIADAQEALETLADDVVVKDWDCYKTAMNAKLATCGVFSDYGIQYATLIAEACNRMSAETVSAFIKETCIPNKVIY